MINKPLVSIIIPTYNQHEIFLRECIESAINQTYSNIEILISDNHSDNDTESILAIYKAKDSRIKVIKPDRFLSMVENFIFAYNKTCGEFICPLSSDDILYPEIIEEQLKPFYTYPELSFSSSMPLFFATDINNAKWVPGELNTGFYSSDIFLDFYIKHRACSWGGILFKTSNYHKIGGFSSEYLFTGDVDAIVKLILLDGGVYCINKPLSAIRQWEREEHTSRTPYVLREIAKIYDNIKGEGVTNKAAKKAKKNIFSKEIFPIAYFIQFNKRAPETIEKTVAVIKENFPNGIYNFVIRNRKNKVGLVFSIVYLSFVKLKNALAKK